MFRLVSRHCHHSSQRNHLSTRYNQWTCLAMEYIRNTFSVRAVPILTAMPALATYHRSGTALKSQQQDLCDIGTISSTALKFIWTVLITSGGTQDGRRSRVCFELLSKS